MTRPGLGQAQAKQDGAQAVYGAIVRNAKGWQPEWAGLKPGEHPRLPVKPPGRAMTAKETSTVGMYRP